MKNISAIIGCPLVLIILLSAMDSFAGRNTDRLIAAYYFGAGYFTLVPENICHDLDDTKLLCSEGRPYPSELYPYEENRVAKLVVIDKSNPSSN